MQRLHNLFAFSVVFFTSTPLLAADTDIAAAAATPASVVSRFLDQLAAAEEKQVFTDVALFKDNEQYRDDKHQLDRLHGDITDGRISFTVIDFKADAELAVVVMKNSVKRPLILRWHPCYVVKQDNRWRILPTITHFKRKYYLLTEDQQARLAKLEGWFKNRKIELEAQVSAKESGFHRQVKEEDRDDNGQVDTRTITYSRNAERIMVTIQRIGEDDESKQGTINMFYQKNKLVFTEVNIGGIRSLNLEPKIDPGVAVELDDKGKVRIVLLFDSKRVPTSAFSRDGTGAFRPISSARLKEMQTISDGIESIISGDIELDKAEPGR